MSPMVDFLPSTRAGNLLVWVVIWSSIGVWSAVTLAVDGLPTFASVVRLVRRFWLGRLFLFAGWAWLGWHIFVRTHF
jgi:hypothetical protein